MRSRPSRLSIGMTALVALAVAACSDQGPQQARVPRGTPVVNFAQTGTQTTQWVIQTKTFGSVQAVSDAVTAAGGRITHSFPEIGVIVADGITSSALGGSTGTNIKVAARDRELQWVPNASQVDMEVASDDAGSDGTNQSTAAFFNAFQWGMRQIQAPAAWAASPGGAGRTVCILDSGVDAGHNDLVGKVTTAISVNTDASFAGNQTPIDYHFHGTYVSSIVSSRGIGIASVAPDAKLCSIKVLGVTGSGSFGDVIAGIITAANMGNVDVINMSLGAYFDLRAPGGLALSQALQAAVDYANSKGVVVVASSGNSGINLDADPNDIVSLPAQLKGVISVGATGPINRQNFDQIASYSNYGGVTGIALVAPGGSGNPVVNADLMVGACTRFSASFPSCAGGTSYLLGNGTSFASPHVAGAAAVLRSKFSFYLKPATVRRCLTSSADVVGPSAIYGAGRLNVFRALSCNP